MGNDSTCPTCGRDDFESWNGVMQHHARSHGESLKSWPDVECEQCGNLFEVRPSREDEAKFCSKECHSKSMVSRVERECDTCGGTVLKVQSQDELSDLSFCDRGCKFEYFTDENHPNYSDDVNSRYYGKNWEKKRSSALERDNYTCQICGETGEILHVHHRQPFDSFDNYEDANEIHNLRTLCATCHGKVEKGPVVERIKYSAMEVHNKLGSGHTESTYHRALETEFSNREIMFSSETTIPILYKGHSVGRRRPDLMVDDGGSTIVVELKAGSNSGESQLLQYLDLLGDDNNFDIESGMLIQFNDDLNIEQRDV